MTPDYKWHTSCSPGWIQNNDTFEFNLKKGTIGECPGDATPLEGKYKFKERQEVRSDKLESGVYVWSADVQTISKELVHASYFSLFQITCTFPCIQRGKSRRVATGGPATSRRNATRRSRRESRRQRRSP